MYADGVENLLESALKPTAHHMGAKGLGMGHALESTKRRKIPVCSTKIW